MVMADEFLGENSVDSVIQDRLNSSVTRAKGIGVDFARQYYKHILAEPQTVHRFYSHESVLMQNNVTIVGQQKIGAAIDALFMNSRIKVLDIKATPTMNDAVVLHVSGELNGRLFIQTFILAPQGLKKFYVSADMFQFLDTVFKNLEPPSKKETCENGGNSLSAKIEAVLSATPVNGHASIVRQAVPHVEDVNSVSQPPVVLPPDEPVPSVLSHGQERVHHQQQKEESPRPKEVPKIEKQSVAAPSTQQPVAPATAPAVVDNGPKTWAKLVGSANTKPSPPAAVATATSTKVTPKPTPTKQDVPSASRPPQHQNGARPATTSVPARVYVGGIVRNVVPETTNQAESEIKAAISKFAEVENVAVPRKALDAPTDPSRTAFAFVTMKSQSDADRLFRSALKDDRGVMTLSMKVASFGFDGDVTIAEQREQQRGGHNGGPRGGGRGGWSGGPQRGESGGRGGFGRGRGGGRGGMRGGF